MACCLANTWGLHIFFVGFVKAHVALHITSALHMHHQALASMSTLHKQVLKQPTPTFMPHPWLGFTSLWGAP